MQSSVGFIQRMWPMWFGVWTRHSSSYRTFSMIRQLCYFLMCSMCLTCV